MTDYFSNRQMRLPPWSYQGDAAVSAGGPSTLAAKSWAGHLVGSVDRANWPILWSLPALATATAMSEAAFAAAHVALPLSRKWGYGQAVPRCPRTVLTGGVGSVKTLAAIAGLTTQLQQLGVLVCFDASGFGQNPFGGGSFLSAGATHIDDPAVSFGGVPFVVTNRLDLAAATKFIGGDLLMLLLGDSQNYGFIDHGPVTGVGPFQEFSNYLGAARTQMLAVGDRFRTIRCHTMMFKPLDVVPGYQSAVVTGVTASFAAHAPAFCTMEFLADGSAVAAACTAVIQNFFGI